MSVSITDSIGHSAHKSSELLKKWTFDFWKIIACNIMGTAGVYNVACMRFYLTEHTGLHFQKAYSH